MTTDKLDNHYFQQLSALMDGDLPPDQARFLLRRLQHDAELTGCWERWQLCGEVLRGRAQVLAPAGFADRVARAVAAEPIPAKAPASPLRNRGLLARWGGGALAASVAVIALFMVRQQVPDETPAQPASALAGHSSDGGGVARPSGAEATATVTAASVAVASIPVRQQAARRSATRNQQVARNAASTRSGPERAVAVAAVPVVHAIAGTGSTGDARDPFSNVQINAPTARPWPRAVVPQYSSGSGAFNAGYTTDRATETFYPFEPRLPATPPVAPPETPSRD